MRSRDQIVRLAMLSAALRKDVSSLPHSSLEDARRCVRFACACITNADELPPLFIAFGLPQLREGFELAVRWSEGENIPVETLRKAWEWTRGQAGTLSSTLSGSAAAHWAIVYAIEAALHAASAEGDAAPLADAATAAESSAKYAQLAQGARNSIHAVEYQAALLAEIFPSRRDGG